MLKLLVKQGAQRVKKNLAEKSWDGTYPCTPITYAVAETLGDTVPNLLSQSRLIQNSYNI